MVLFYFFSFIFFEFDSFLIEIRFTYKIDIPSSVYPTNFDIKLCIVRGYSIFFGELLILGD
jgi:hypothetical protein